MAMLNTPSPNNTEPFVAGDKAAKLPPFRTTPTAFVNPHSIWSKLGRGLWAIVFLIAYRWTPPRLGMPWRRILLLAFGAKIGNSWIHPSTRIWAPWLLEVGDETYIDRRCNLYNAFGCTIGDRVIISFESTLCSATHKCDLPGYPLCGGPIIIDSDCWLAAQSFVFPDLHIGAGAVVGARSVVTNSVTEWTVVAGNPAKIIRQRKRFEQNS